MSEILVIKLGGTTIAEQSQVLGEVAAVARRRPRVRDVEVTVSEG